MLFLTQVLGKVNFSYAAAANSIFWPIISLIIFGTIFICLRCAAYYNRCTTPKPETNNIEPLPEDAPPYWINYSTLGDSNSRGLDAFPPAYHETNGGAAAGISLEFPGMTVDKQPVGDVPGGSAFPTQGTVAHPPPNSGQIVDDAAVVARGERGTPAGTTGNGSEERIGY